MSACDWAACKEPGTTASGNWTFCVRHAESDRLMAAGVDPEPERVPDDFLAPEATGHGTPARARQHHRDGESPCPPCQAAANRYAADVDRRRAMTTPAPPHGLAMLLETASGHHSARVRRLGERIETSLDDLRVLLKASEAETEARQEIARLETQLAEAKAALRGGKPVVKPAPDGTNMRTEPLMCRKGCGKVSHGAQGRAAHERACRYGEAVA